MVLAPLTKRPPAAWTIPVHSLHEHVHLMIALSTIAPSHGLTGWLVMFLPVFILLHLSFSKK